MAATFALHGWWRTY
ncbi:trp operon leader peptide [Salmonella enterica]